MTHKGTNILCQNIKNSIYDYRSSPTNSREINKVTQRHMLELYKKRTNKTQYVKMSEAFRKIYLHHQALLKDSDDVNIFYEKLRSS